MMTAGKTEIQMAIDCEKNLPVDRIVVPSAIESTKIA
jgi:hypothetical protein